MASASEEDLTKSSLTLLVDEKNRKLEELSRYFSSLRAGIHETEMRLTNRLEMLYDECRGRIINRKNELSQLRDACAENEKKLRSNALNQVLKEIVTRLKTEIAIKEREQVSIPMIVINWNYRVLTDLENNCIGKSPPYADRCNPMWSWGSEGNENSTSLSYPQDLSISQLSGEIYVVDRCNDRVQVFSPECNFIRSITNPILDTPARVCNSFDSLYLSQPEKKMILRFNTADSQLIKYIPLSSTPSGLFCHSSNLVYVCEYERPNILVFACDLTYQYHIELECRSFETNQQFDNTRTETVQMTSDELFVLFSDCEYPLQCFSIDGHFLRCIISEERIDRAMYFCLDPIGNILISDWDANRIRVFTSSGNDLVTIGRDGQAGSGDIFHPQGIAVTKNFNIVIVDWKQTNSLQIF